jgi:hypothetical protein
MDPKFQSGTAAPDQQEDSSYCLRSSSEDEIRAEKKPQVANHKLHINLDP